ncbi:MAG: dethiobiotin synthase [Gammaproteobacteria bacterium]
MQVFISGTDTNIGKTIISAWLCLHTKYAYFKPIQTGSLEQLDSKVVSDLSTDIQIYPEIYLYKTPISPHLAAILEKQEIDIAKIKLPDHKNLIIEGAGGLLVPLNKKYFIIDLIFYLDIPVILVASSRLGTINHTLLSLKELKRRNINTLGVIINGEPNQDIVDAIEYYGNVKVLAQFPMINGIIDKDILNQIPLSYNLNFIFNN